MTGRNEIHFCKAEMIAAMEHYLNTVLLKEKVVIDNVKEIREITGNSTAFVISIQPVEKAGIAICRPS